MPITKRPCTNCPFRCDGAGIAVHPGRLEGIVSDLLADDQQTFVCHKTLDKERMTCAGAVGLMSKLGRLPVIARLGLAYGVITKEDIVASAAMVIDPANLGCARDGRLVMTRGNNPDREKTEAVGTMQRSDAVENG